MKPVKVTDEIRAKIQDYAITQIETFYDELNKAFSESYLTKVFTAKHRTRSILPKPSNSMGTRKVSFRIAKSRVVDDEHGFLVYTIKAHDGHAFHTVHRRYEQFKLLHDNIRTKVYDATLPMRSSGMFGLSGKVVSEEYGKKREQKLTKYLTACVNTHNNKAPIADLKTFLFENQRDPVMKRALNAALARVSKLNTLLYDDVGEGLTKWICQSFPEDEQKEIINSFSGNIEKRTNEYFRSVIEVSNPTIEFAIDKKVKEITSAMNDFHVKREGVVAEKEKVIALVNELIGSSLEELLSSSTANLDQFVSELTVRSQKMITESNEGRRKSKNVMKGFAECLLPDMSLSRALAVAMRESLTNITQKAIDNFKDFDGFKDTNGLTEELSRAFALFPVMMEMFCDSVNVEQYAEVFGRLINIRQEMKKPSFHEKNYQEAMLDITNLIEDAYVGSVYKAEIARDVFVERLNERKEAEGNNTNAGYYCDLLMRIMLKYCIKLKHVLRVFADRYFARAFLGLPSPQLDAAFRNAMKLAGKELKKYETSLFGEFLSGMASTAFLNYFNASVISECQEKLLELKIADKFRFVLHPLVIAEQVVTAKVLAVYKEKITASLVKMHAEIKANKVEYNFFKRELDRGEVSSDCSIDGSCSCEAPGCSCKTVTKAKYELQPAKFRVKHALKPKEELLKMGKLVMAKKTKARVVIESDDEDFGAGVNVVADFDPEASFGGKFKGGAKVKVGVDVNVKGGAKAKGNVDVKAKGNADVKAKGNVDVKAKADVKVKADADLKVKSDAKIKADAGLKVNGGVSLGAKGKQSESSDEVEVEAKAKGVAVDIKVEKPKLEVGAKVKVGGEAKAKGKKSSESSESTSTTSSSSSDNQAKGAAGIKAGLKAGLKVEAKADVKADAKIDAKADVKVEAKGKKKVSYSTSESL